MKKSLLSEVRKMQKIAGLLKEDTGNSYVVVGSDETYEVQSSLSFPEFCKERARGILADLTSGFEESGYNQDYINSYVEEFNVGDPDFQGDNACSISKNEEEGELILNASKFEQDVIDQLLDPETDTEETEHILASLGVM